MTDADVIRKALSDLCDTASAHVIDNDAPMAPINAAYSDALAALDRLAADCEAAMAALRVAREKTPQAREVGELVAVIGTALDLGLQVWRTTDSRDRFIAGFDALTELERRVSGEPDCAPGCDKHATCRTSADAAVATAHLTEQQIAAGRERLRRAAEDGERLYRVRMHGENGETIADGNRIDGILTRELVDALALVDALIAETDDELERWEETTAARLDEHAAEQDAAALRKSLEGIVRLPTDRDLLLNAEVRALCEVAARGLGLSLSEVRADACESHGGRL